MPGSWAPRYYRASFFELATSYLTDMVEGPDLVAEWVQRLGPRTSARQVLEEIIVEALEHAPCIIRFSGGRDSSALLAVACHVARREGLPLPVPFTFRYGDEGEAQESDWQELVIRHLRIDDWEIHDAGSSLDIVGPTAQEFLLKHGLVYPPTMYNKTLTLQRACGGAHMTGEGGDEVFGFRRTTFVRRILDQPTYLLDRAHLGYGALTLGTRATRTWAWGHKLRDIADGLTYLRPEGADQLRHHVARHLASEPFRYARSLGWHLRRKQIAAYEEGLAAFAAEHDVHHVDPLLEPKFVAAYALTVRPLGLANRAQAMKALFGDVLPEQVLTRSSKAVFNRAFLTGTARQFASTWSGAGLDPEIIDAEALREAWLSEWPPSQSFGLMQAAWLHDNQQSALSSAAR